MSILQVEEGKWYKMSKRGETFICCDCCLTHVVKFKFDDGVLYTQWFRDDKATAGYRKSKINKKTLKSLIK